MMSILKVLKNIFVREKYPLLEKNEYLNLFNNIKDDVSNEIDQFEKNTGYKIKKLWIDNLALHTQIVKKKSALNYHHGRLLYSALRSYISKNKGQTINILETGTARGFSSICMSKALIDSNCYGKIYTIDIVPNNEKIYWNCIDDWEGKKTRLQLLNNWSDEIENVVFLTGDCDNVLKNFYLSRINFAFLDAQHNYLNIKNEFNYVSNRQFKGDIIIFDDVNVDQFPEISKFINELEKKKTYKLKVISSSEYRSYCLAIKL